MPWLFILALLLQLAAVKATGIACNTTDQCENKLRKGSECMKSGFCSNPFHNGGCLAHMLPEYNVSKGGKKYVRVCTSADPPEAEALGNCVNHKEFDHVEIRFMAMNWESVFFETWIMQILLSEILGVPTSIDTGYADKFIDFYNVESRFDYGKSYDWDAFRNAMEVQDCRLLQQPENTSEYKSCAHVSMENWEGQEANLMDLQKSGIIEKPMALGVLGETGWFIPRFTGERDPTLTTYLGLMGEENRYKLAETFKRPTTWGDYCAEVSMTNCSVPDEVALRPPADGEETQYFSDGFYTGHFRYTTENNCMANPFGCTGHIADFPCGWTSFQKQQAYHLNIALESNGDEPMSGGYSYSQLTQIWAAANATKSDVMMLWWTPEALFQAYQGTDAEFFRVALPSPTLQCVENRVNPDERCSGDPDKVYGTADGACDQSAHLLMKVVTKNLYGISHDDRVPSAKQSPAYETVANFEISDLQLGTIFKKWLAMNTDKWGYDPREATCQWVVENLDLIESFIPRTYPRVLQKSKEATKEPMFYISYFVGILALLLIVAVSFFVYKFRKRRVIMTAQIEFLFLLLTGLTLVQIGSFVLAVPPTDFTCRFSTWLINFGYTLELTPLIVKVAALNRIASAARSMRRIKLKRKNLFATVATLSSLMLVYLTIWTVISAPHEEHHYELTDGMNEHGETIVKSYNDCVSDDAFWIYIALGWRSILLLWAIVLAFQTRKCPNSVKESPVLGMLVYSQFVFLVMILILFYLRNTINVPQADRYQSLIQSCDVAAVCCIYFIPKLVTTDEDVVRASGAGWMLSAGISMRNILGVGRNLGNVSSRTLARQTRKSMYDSANFEIPNQVQGNRLPVIDSEESEEPNVSDNCRPPVTGETSDGSMKVKTPKSSQEMNIPEATSTTGNEDPSFSSLQEEEEEKADIEAA